jgi:hypothetical protein
MTIKRILISVIVMLVVSIWPQAAQTSTTAGELLQSQGEGTDNGHV